MLSGEKILITGPAGQIALPMAASLAAGNEVWGIARFSDAASRERVDALGVTTRACDLGSGDLRGLFDRVTPPAAPRRPAGAGPRLRRCGPGQRRGYGTAPGPLPAGARRARHVDPLG